MRKQTLTVAACATVTAVAAGRAMGETVTLDIAGVESWDGFGEAVNNAIVLSNLGDVTIIGLGWDNVVGNGDDSGVSWGNEMNMFVGTAGGATGVNAGFFPSEGSGSPGGIWGPASSGGVIDLVAQGLSFQTEAAGLYFEFYESYDDGAGAIDAHYDSGTITIEYAVPAPGALALLGLAGLAGRRRRRA